MRLLKTIKQAREIVLRIKPYSEETRQVVGENLKKALDWVSPELETERLTLVIRCNECKNYKRYRKKITNKNPRKQKPVYLCSKDKLKKPKGWFCAYGEEKINE